jgi:hypothetical protein
LRAPAQEGKPSLLEREFLAEGFLQTSGKKSHFIYPGFFSEYVIKLDMYVRGNVKLSDLLYSDKLNNFVLTGELSEDTR